MTDPFVLYPSLFLGLVFVVIYLFRCHRHKRSVNLAVMTNAVLSASGVVCGILLVVGSFVKEVMSHLTGINVYIFIAGIAVCYVSARTVYGDVLSARNDGENKNEHVSKIGHSTKEQQVSHDEHVH